MDEVYLKSYIEQLYNNQNIGAQESQKNLFLKEDYYAILKPVQEIINANLDRSIAEIREILFENSHLKDAVSDLINVKALAPGVVVSYGTLNHKETIVIGKQQEVTIGENGEIVDQLEYMSEDTIFDLASMTKLFTSLCIMKLVQKGLINLSDNIINYVPEFSNLSDVTIFDLLAFRVPLITNERVDLQDEKEKALNVLFHVRVNENFDHNHNPYTDMGAMVLKYVIESVSHMDYYDFLKQEILVPLGMKDTYSNVPQRKLYRVASNNISFKFIKDGTAIMTSDVVKGVPYDPKAKILRGEKGDLLGHAGLFSSATDMAMLAKGLIESKVLSEEMINTLGQNQTGRIYKDETGNTKSIQYLGYLCYSKNPILYDTEVYHALSGRTFASAGWTGTQLTVDPINKIFTFMGANKAHNRVISVGSTQRKKYEVIDGEKQYIDLPQYGLKVVSSRFAWEKDKVIHKALQLTLQYKMLEDYRGLDLKETDTIRRF